MRAPVKFSARKIFDCANIREFLASIVQILTVRGYEQARFCICEYKDVKFLTKIGFYRKTDAELYKDMPKDVMPHIDAEIQILQAFKRDFIDTRQTPCIVELIYHNICTDVGKLLPKGSTCDRLMNIGYLSESPEESVEHTLCAYYDRVQAGLAHNKVAFMVLEKCDITLDAYLRRGINTPIAIAVLRSIMFMIIHAHYVIKRKYPGAVHRDAHTSNYMLKFDLKYKFDPKHIRYNVFRVGKHRYAVPYFGITPKIIDFGFASIPELGINSNVVEDRRMMHRRPTNDMITLFHYVYHVSESDYVNKLLEELEPTRLFANYSSKYIYEHADETPSVEQLMESKVWDDYAAIHPTPAQIFAEYGAK